MRTTLTRTQHTERSCRVRLALAEWLHRRLRRGKLPTDNEHSKSLLQRYRKQVALLRSTLHQQLSELAVSPVKAASTATAALAADTSSVELGAANKRARVERM